MHPPHENVTNTATRHTPRYIILKANQVVKPCKIFKSTNYFRQGEYFTIFGTCSNRQVWHLYNVNICTWFLCFLDYTLSSSVCENTTIDVILFCIHLFHSTLSNTHFHSYSYHLYEILLEFPEPKTSVREIFEATVFLNVTSQEMIIRSTFIHFTKIRFS